jgi:Uma2 family endonuclease
MAHIRLFVARIRGRFFRRRRVRLSLEAPMALSETDLDQLIRDRAIRLLVLGSGKHIWEASPSPLHQMVVDEIRASIRATPHHQGGDIRGCGCHHLSDVYIRLPDTSLVRPDIAVFCERPPRQREALQIVPQAVIEVISPGYEAKDLEDLPPVYLANGVRDVLALDVDRQRVTHFRRDGTAIHTTPLTLELECGCACTLC